MMGPAVPVVSRGLLDTSVIIALKQLPLEALPAEPAIAAVTLAELAAGPHATDDPQERARRQDRLQRIEALLDPLPFDAGAARAYGRVYAATRAHDRKPRGARAADAKIRSPRIFAHHGAPRRRRRSADLPIAATALANDLPLFTPSPEGFDHLDEIGLQLHAL